MAQKPDYVFQMVGGGFHVDHHQHVVVLHLHTLDGEIVDFVMSGQALALLGEQAQKVLATYPEVTEWKGRAVN